MDETPINRTEKIFLLFVGAELTELISLTVV
jgi:hypothetical protein